MALLFIILFLFALHHNCNFYVCVALMHLSFSCSALLHAAVTSKQQSYIVSCVFSVVVVQDVMLYIYITIHPNTISERRLQSLLL